MTRKLSTKDISLSQNSVNQFRTACGSRINANVKIKRWQGSGEVCECIVYIGHGRYDDHNMPNVSIDWPDGCTIPERYGIHSDFDCAYVRMKYHGSGLLTIYLDEISIDIIAIDSDDDESEMEED